jgi:hypothetical protein
MLKITTALALTLFFETLIIGNPEVLEAIKKSKPQQLKPAVCTVTSDNDLDVYLKFAIDIASSRRVTYLDESKKSEIQRKLQNIIHKDNLMGLSSLLISLLVLSRGIKDHAPTIPTIFLTSISVGFAYMFFSKAEEELAFKHRLKRSKKQAYLDALLVERILKERKASLSIGTEKNMGIEKNIEIVE